RVLLEAVVLGRPVGVEPRGVGGDPDLDVATDTQRLSHIPRSRADGSALEDSELERHGRGGYPARRDAGQPDADRDCFASGARMSASNASRRSVISRRDRGRGPAGPDAFPIARRVVRSSPADYDAARDRFLRRDYTPVSPDPSGIASGVRACHARAMHDRSSITPTSLPGGNLRLAEGLTLTRVGYGAMQLAGPGVWGPPRDPEQAIAVLREAVKLGITHIDTSDYYGPYTVNELIREALHPYPDGLHIATKVGARRDPDKSWPPALSRRELITAVHENLDHLGLDTLDLVNLRVGGVFEPTPGSIAEPFTVLAQLRQQGLIRHLGVSG